MKYTTTTEKLLFIQLFIGLLGVMIGLFLFMTHYNQDAGRFLIKTGLIFEGVIVLRLILHYRALKRKSQLY